MKIKLKGHKTPGMRFSARYWLTVILFVITGLKANAQYYPAPYPVSEEKLNQLLINLKNSKNDVRKIPVLLSLSNLYFNKPLRKDADLAKALDYAKQVALLSTASHNIAGFNQAQERLADVLSDTRQITAAEDLMKTVNDTTRLNMLIMLSYKNFLTADDITDHYFKQIIAHATNATKLAISLHDIKKELWAKTMLTYANTFVKPAVAEAEFNNLIKEYEQKKHPYLPCMYVYLGRYYGANGNLDKDIAITQKGIESMRAIKDTLLLTDCLIHLGEINATMGQQTKSIEYFDQATQHFLVHRGEVSMAVIVNRKADRLQTMHKNKEALAYIMKSMTQYPPEHDDDMASYQYIIGKCYESLGNYALAEKYLVSSYTIKKKNGTADFLFEKEMCEFFIRANKYAVARPYLDRFFAHKGTMPLGPLAHAEYMAYMIDSAARDYKSAMAHLGKAKYLDNVMLSEKKNRDVTNFSIKYETAKKDGKIALLTQSAKYEAANARQANLVKNLSVAGILLVLVIAGLLYRQNMLKQKSNQVMINKNKLLERLVDEKEWLLKEVHHRVKNNLHTVICLLESQAAYLENDALKAIENSQHRIYAMSLIHQKLYQTDDIESIDMAAYFNDFLRYLDDSFDQSDRIYLQANVDSFKLQAAQAIPLGLIVNEAITNSYKYAFPNRKKGLITVELKQIADEVRLTITDDGIGMQYNVETEEISSLGVQLMKGLSRDLKGRIKFENDNGTKITVCFNVDPFAMPLSEPLTTAETIPA